MSVLCRICMFPKFDLINLVKDGTDTLERSGEKFEDFFGIKVKELPYCQRICKDCDKQLMDFYYFKQQALRTHNYMIDKAYDLKPRWAGVKEDMDVNDVEIIDDTLTITQEKNHIEYTEVTLSEALDSYKQIAPLMYEVANESISEEKIEMEGVALNIKDNEGEVDKMIKEYTNSFSQIMPLTHSPKLSSNATRNLNPELIGIMTDLGLHNNLPESNTDFVDDFRQIQVAEPEQHEIDSAKNTLGAGTPNKQLLGAQSKKQIVNEGKTLIVRTDLFRTEGAGNILQELFTELEIFFTNNDLPIQIDKQGSTYSLNVIDGETNLNQSHPAPPKRKTLLQFQDQQKDKPQTRYLPPTKAATQIHRRVNYRD